MKIFGLMFLLICSPLSHASVADVSIDVNEVKPERGDEIMVDVFSRGTFEGYVVRNLPNGDLSIDLMVDDRVPMPYAERSRISIVPEVYMRSVAESDTDIVLNFNEYNNGNSATAFPQGSPTAIGTEKVVVVRSLPDPEKAITNPSGTWYQPSLSGTGFVVMQYQNGTVVQYYGYDADGGRLWLLSDVMDKAWVKGETQTLTMYEGKADNTTGFTKPPANAPGIEQWGTLELQFDSCNNAIAKLKGIDGEQAFDLERLAAPMATHCVDGNNF